jgi:hypothetical protein
MSKSGFSDIKLNIKQDTTREAGVGEEGGSAQYWGLSNPMAVQPCLN